MLRSISKTCFAYACTRSRARRTAMPFIIGYHRVVEDFERCSRNTIPSMLISTRMLEQHIDWLAKRYTIMSLDEIGARVDSNVPFERPAAAITFDDGYADVYHHAFPILRRKGIPAAVFVVTSLAGTGRPQIFDRLYRILKNSVSSEQERFRLMTLALNVFPQDQIESLVTSMEQAGAGNAESELDEMAPLTWDMIETMHRNGVTIGSHTVRHRLLPSETIETAQQELAQSKQTLESRLGAEVKHFAYPDGRFNPAVVRAVNSAGYRFAYSICSSRDREFPRLTIPRKVLWERACVNPLGRFSPSIMDCHARRIFERRGACEHDHRKQHGTIS